MAEFDCTPLQEKPTLKYVDRLLDIKRAICTLDESLTPSKRIGNKSIGLSPMFGSSFQNKHLDSIALLDHQNVLTPSKTTLLDHVGLESSQVSFSESSIMINPEVTDSVDKITSASLLIKGFSKAYKDMSMDDALSVISSYTNQCDELYHSSKSMLSAVKHSKKLSQQIKNACSDIINERYTWKLLGAIYQNKLNTSLEEDMTTESHMSTINRLYAQDEEIRHCQVVLDWLESNAAELLPNLPTKVGYFSGKVSWENTFHSLCNQKLKKTVSSMDPDAPTREDAPLNEIDLEDQGRLVKHLFYLVRAGQSDEAQKLCISAGQCWRAAVIDGWRLYNDPNYDTSSTEREAVEGNVNRALWKTCCWEFCNAGNVSTEERALYGVLSGNLQAVLPICSSFHDVLWAHFKTLIDQRVEEELCDAMLPPSYWGYQLDVDNVVETLSKTKQSGNLYNKLQLQLIVGDLDGIFSTVSDTVAGAGVSERRFLCHLLLVLEILHPNRAPEVLYSTLCSYAKSLRHEGCLQEMIYYASLVPVDMQVSLLTDVLFDIDDDVRPDCVDHAIECSIPIEDVTMNIYHRILESYSPSHNDVISVANISDSDARVVSAVSWLLLTEFQRSAALREANRLIRRLLGARKHAPAYAVFEMIPPDTIEVINREWLKEYPSSALPPDDINAIREYLCLQAYLDTHQAYNDWCSHSANRPPTPSYDTNRTITFSEQVAEDERMKSYDISLQQWEQSLTVQTQLTRDKMLNVMLFIDGGWLVDEVEGTDPARAEQLEALRRHCIPATTALLVNVLSESGQHTAVVELCDYIASEQYQLYKLFTQQELKKLLDKVYDSSIRCGCDPLQFNSNDDDDNLWK